MIFQQSLSRVFRGMALLSIVAVSTPASVVAQASSTIGETPTTLTGQFNVTWPHSAMSPGSAGPADSDGGQWTASGSFDVDRVSGKISRSSAVISGSGPGHANRRRP